jgi:GT2 family glycosyltransferase
MMETKPDVSIILVNWNSVAYLNDCLESLRREAESIQLECVVIDNASFDGSFDVCGKYPFVKFVQLEKNSGFAGANNRGALHSSSDVFLFLNPDTIVHKGTIRTMLATLRSSAQNGAVSCKILNRDGTIQTSSLLPFPTLTNMIFNIEWLKVRTHWIKMWGISPLFSKSNNTFEVQAISGACIMVSRKAFESAGGFSEEYFMYSEDIDLCYKLHLMGYKNIYTPAAQIVHFGGGSTKSAASAFSTVMMQEARYLYFKKFRGNIYAFAYKTVMFFLAVIRILLLVFPAIISRNVNSLIKWYYVLQWIGGRSPLRNQRL